MRKFLLVAFVLLLTGCAFHRAPHPMYEGAPALANTAVFSAMVDNTGKHKLAQIRSVDGKETPCFEVGCPLWVRVLPGKHVFLLRYSTDYQLGVGVISHKFADVPVEVGEMKPRHVYVARYLEVSGRVSVSVEDLGERRDYGITLGREGLNQKYYPVEF